MTRYTYTLHDGSFGSVCAERYERIGKAWLFYIGGDCVYCIPADWLDGKIEVMK